MASGNIDLVMVLLAGLETRQCNGVATQLINKIRGLQEDRKTAAKTLGDPNAPEQGEQGKSAAQASMQNIGTDISLLQNMLQDVMSQKSEAQSMASNFMKARHDTAMGIIRNMA